MEILVGNTCLISIHVWSKNEKKKKEINRIFSLYFISYYVTPFLSWYESNSLPYHLTFLPLSKHKECNKSVPVFNPGGIFVCYGRVCHRGKALSEGTVLIDFLFSILPRLFFYQIFPSMFLLPKILIVPFCNSFSSQNLYPTWTLPLKFYDLFTTFFSLKKKNKSIQ